MNGVVEYSYNYYEQSLQKLEITKGPYRVTGS